MTNDQLEMVLLVPAPGPADPPIALPIKTTSTAANLSLRVSHKIPKSEKNTDVVVATKISARLAELKTAIMNANVAVNTAATPIRRLDDDS